MKRSFEKFESMASVEEMKRSRTGNKVSIRILIRSKTAGVLIGKAGVNIQQLRRNNNANVRIPDNEGPERVMFILADDAQSVISVIEQSLPNMLDDGEIPYTSSKSQELRLLINENIVGGIIGKGGSTIHQIERESNAKVHAYSTCAPQSTERCVSVRGTSEEIAAALNHIIPFVATRQPQGFEEPYNPLNFDCFYANEYGGYGTPSDIMGSNPMPRAPRERSMQFPDRAMFSGPGSYFPAQGAMGDASFSVGMKNFSSNFDDEEEDDGPIQTSKVTVPKDMGGAIIGPGGSRIRKVRMDSKADIKIEEPENNADERIITITGTPKRIQTAQYLLQQCVRQFGTPNGGRNRW